MPSGPTPARPNPTPRGRYRIVGHNHKCEPLHNAPVGEWKWKCPTCGQRWRGFLDSRGTGRATQVGWASLPWILWRKRRPS